MGRAMSDALRSFEIAECEWRACFATEQQSPRKQAKMSIVVATNKHYEVSLAMWGPEFSQRKPEKLPHPCWIKILQGEVVETQYTLAGDEELHSVTLQEGSVTFVGNR